MVINNLDIDRAGRATWPLKTDPPLVVEADAVLALAFAPQGFQPVAGLSPRRGASSAGRRGVQPRAEC
jgi:hypothetical protein